MFEICDKLCTLTLEGKDELRDIYSIGLKTLVKDVPEETGRGVAQRLIRRLLDGVGSDKDDIRLESLECLSDLFKRFGREVGRQEWVLWRFLGHPSMPAFSWAGQLP